MVDTSAPRLDAVFRALADATRRAMLQSLALRPRSVGELAAPFAMTLAAASKHIKVLEGAGLVRRTVRGRIHECRLDARPLRDGAEWMRRYERFWSERLDELESALRAEDASRAPAGRGSGARRGTTSNRRKS